MPPPLSTVRVPELVVPIFEKAQEYVRRYFDGIAFAPEEGRIAVGEQRYVLVRAGALSVELFDVVRGLFGEEGGELADAVARGLLYDLSHAMGLSDARVFAEKMGLVEPIERLSAGPIHFAHAGWAFVDLHDECRPVADPSFVLVYDHPYSFEADAWRSAGRTSERPACVMNAGYSSGWCEASFGMPLVAVELTCRARGDTHCRFVMAPPDRVRPEIEAYLVAHPELGVDTSTLYFPGFFERDRAAEALVVAERRRRYLEEEVSQRIAEALPGAMLHVAADGSVVRFNQAALAFMGVRAEQMVGVNLRDFQGMVFYESGEPVPPEEMPLRRAIDTGEPQGPTTLGLRAFDGTTRWGVFHSAPVLDPTTHEITGAIVTSVDISERKRQEEERQELEGRLREAQRLESLGTLAGGIAHDFNNILVGVLGNASLLRTEVGSSAPALERIALIEEAAERASGLTAQLLAYAGKGQRTLRGVDLSAACSEALGLTRVLMAPSVELELRLATGLPPVEGDPSQIREALVNVLTNAAEALGRRGGRVRIETGTLDVASEALPHFREATDARPGTYVFARIEDDGEGMAPEVLSTVFDPFFSTKFTGRGLGLAVVRGIVRGHHGIAHVESTPGRGCRFELMFPAAPGAEVPRRPPAAPSTARSIAGTVLVIDDEPAVREFVTRAVGGMGADVVQARDGDEGLERFRALEDRVVAVVLDVTMPRKTGHEVLEAIRARRADLPVLLMSGYDRERTLALVGDDPYTDFLAKPFRVDALREALARRLAVKPR